MIRVSRETYVNFIRNKKSRANKNKLYLWIINVSAVR